MRKLAIFCIFLMFTQIAGAQSIITIDVLESGDAIWIEEKSVPLITQAEIDDWNEFIQKGHNYRYQTDIEVFQNNTVQFVRSAENFSNRPMQAENFNISYNITNTLSGKVGIVRYSFEWENFSRTEEANIYIGDVFSEGMELPADNVLIIDIPEGYEVQSASPEFDKRDGNRLIWDGTLHHNFSKGEPSLVLLRTTDAAISVGRISVGKTGENSTLPVMAILVVLIAIALVVLWSWRRPKKLTSGKIEHYEDLLKQMPKELLHEVLKIPGVWPKIIQLLHKELGIKSVEELEKAAREHRLSNTDLTQSSDQIKEILGYEEMIERYLAKSGGQAYQSEIVKEIGLSKSKISIVLAQMKENGRILKIRKGKENIIRLAEVKS